MTKQMTKEFDKWWSEQSRKGDPQRDPNLVVKAFEIGWACGHKEAEKEAEDDKKDVVTEARWSERQGDEYGSF